MAILPAPGTAAASTTGLVLERARGLIGMHTYKQMDCSHFVHAAFQAAGLMYPYADTSTFANLAAGPNAKFVLIPNAQKQAGDVILIPARPGVRGHMGIYDPQGCAVVATNQECSRMNNNLPFLSSRTTNDRGPDFGRIEWWGGNYRVYRWK